MAIRTREQLKQWFQTGDTPTQQQFWDWLDSFLHKNDVGAGPSDLVVTFAPPVNSFTVPNSTQLLVLTGGDFSTNPIIVLPPANEQVGRVIKIDNRAEPPYSYVTSEGVFDPVANVFTTSLPDGFRGDLVSDGVRWTLLKYDDGTGAGGGASAINDLTDVTITSAAAGDTLEYNGTAFVNVNKSFTELTGTTWDGSNKYKTLTANLSLSLNGTRTAGILYIAGNSSYTLTINGTAITINNTGDSMVGYIKQNGVYVITTDLSPVAIAGPDVTAPTVSSATAIDANTIRIVFSESMGTVTTAGHSFKQNGTTITPDSVSGSGTTWNFVVSETLLSTDTILRSYNSSIGTTADTAATPNQLGSYTDVLITNSVSSAEALNFTVVSSGFAKTSNYWSGSNSGWANQGLANKKLSGDGYIEFYLPNATACNAMIAFRENAVNEPYTAGNYKAAIWFDSNSPYGMGKIDNGSVSLPGVNGSFGSYYRITRQGSTLSVYRRVGSTLTFLFDFTYSTTVDLFIQGHTNGTSQLTDAVGSGLIPV